MLMSVTTDTPGMFLMVDCRDSFVFNLVAMLEDLGADVETVREADITGSFLDGTDPEALILSPGPGSPSPDRGSWMALEHYWDRVPVLGVCLGHQTVCAACGADIVSTGGPKHGKVVRIYHNGSGVLSGIPDGFHAVRYNSLCVDPVTVPGCLSVDATDQHGDVMAVSVPGRRVHGVQFHPESFLTEFGRDIVSNFVSEVWR